MWRFPKLEHVNIINILNILTPMVLETPDFLKHPFFWGGVSLVWQPEISIWGWLPWHPPTTQRTTRRTTIVAGTTEAAPPSVAPMKSTDLGSEHHHFGTCQDPHFWVKFTILHPQKKCPGIASTPLDAPRDVWFLHFFLAKITCPNGFAGELPAANDTSLQHQGFDLRPFLFPAAFDAQFEAIDEVVKACALGS